MKIQRRVIQKARGRAKEAFSYTGTDFEIEGTTLVKCLNRKAAHLVIPNGIATIDDEAFQFCSCLTSIEVPSGVTNIGYAAFEFSRSLISIKIPSFLDVQRKSVMQFWKSKPKTNFATKERWQEQLKKVPAFKRSSIGSKLMKQRVGTTKNCKSKGEEKKSRQTEITKHSNKQKPPKMLYLGVPLAKTIQAAQGTA